MWLSDFYPAFVHAILRKHYGRQESIGMGMARRAFQIARNVLRSRRSDTSYAGEYRHLKTLLSKLAIDGGFVVDIAASDGVTQSCTFRFFSDSKWRGLAVEMDPDRFASLAFIYAGFADARLARCRVTPANVSGLLLANEVPSDIELLNLDIDSYDLHVIEAMLRTGTKPKLISMEVNEKVPPPLHFTVDFDDRHYWKGDHFFGCSLAAAANVVKPFGYRLESLQLNNAIFVREDVAGEAVHDCSVERAYDIGYRNHPERLALFPYNANVDCALGRSAEENLVFFNDFFKPYLGKYTLR